MSKQRSRLNEGSGDMSAEELREFKRVLEYRLCREKRWKGEAGAEVRKNKLIWKGRDLGMSRADAHRFAWETLAELYPPLEKGEEKGEKKEAAEAKKGEAKKGGVKKGEGGLKLDGPVEYAGGEQEMSHLERLQWVELALGRLAAGEKVSELEIPGPACLGWLDWARKSPDKFRDTLDRQKNKVVKEEAGLSEGELQADEMEKMLGEAIDFVDEQTAREGVEALDS